MSPVSLKFFPGAVDESVAPKSSEPTKARDAAEQFEALLVGQILRSARESSGNSGDCATEYAEQHLASVIAARGGLGLARLITEGLVSHRLQA